MMHIGTFGGLVGYISIVFQLGRPIRWKFTLFVVLIEPVFLTCLAVSVLSGDMMGLICMEV